jgi:NADPH2:quinone reductase
VKAIVFEKTGDASVMHPAELPTPELRPGMVLIRVHAAGINFADTFFIRGEYMIKPNLPDIPGLEAAGIIAAAAPDVKALKAGMRVTAFARKSYAEYCVAPAAGVVPIPDFMSFEQAAAFPIQVLTAWHLLHTAYRTEPGNTVVIHSAAGGVGLAAIQIAKAAGARVIGTVSSDAKAVIAKQYGADEVINYATHDFAAETMRLTDGRGADLILDAVGKPTFEKGLGCLATLGQIVLYGRAGGAPEPVNPLALFGKSLRMSAFALPTVLPIPYLMRTGVEGSFVLIREGKLKIHIGRTLPLAQAVEAHRFLESRDSTGKLLLIP